MPTPTAPAPLVWSGTLRPPPAPGSWRRVARFELAGPDGAARRLSGWAERGEGVTLFVDDGLDHERIGERVRQLLDTSAGWLAAPTRQVMVVGRDAFAPGFVGLAYRRREIWLTDGEQVAERPLIELGYVLAHELAHNAGGAVGGAPDALREDWRRAIADDAAHARRRLLGPGASGMHAQVPMRLGRAGVTAYAEAEGECEDWAEAIALWDVERRVGNLVGPRAAALLTGREVELSFADCYPARAAIIARWAGRQEATGRSGTA